VHGAPLSSSGAHLALSTASALFFVCVHHADTDEESRIYVEHVVEFLLDVVSEEGLQRVLVLGIGGAPSP
jgi:hypothetical protein